MLQGATAVPSAPGPCPSPQRHMLCPSSSLNIPLCCTASGDPWAERSQGEHGTTLHVSTEGETSLGNTPGKAKQRGAEEVGHGPSPSL